MLSLKNKICLVTGASSGIGKAIAQKFAESGAIVYANSRQASISNDWDDCLDQKAATTKIVPLYFDISDESAVKDGLLSIWREHKKLDVIVNNAGIVSYEPLGMIAPKILHRMIDVNIVGTLNVLQIGARLMRRHSKGSIINISSATSIKGASGQVAYSATKGAINSITLSASRELAPVGIRVNAIAPGMISTERLNLISEQHFPQKVEEIPLGRMGLPSEVAQAALYFASDSSFFTTGQIICLDGGMRF